MRPNAAQFYEFDARSIHAPAHYYNHVPDNIISDGGITTRGCLWKMNRRLQLTGLFTEAAAKE